MTLRRASHDQEEQSDFLADLPLYPLLASVAPTHSDRAKTLSQLQKSLLEQAQTHACIYVLVDPRDGTVRYVGRTNRPQARYQVHCARGSGKVRAWVNELREQDCLPVMQIVEIVRREDEGVREYAWIRFFSTRAALLNTGYYALRKPSRFGRRDWTLPLFGKINISCLLTCCYHGSILRSWITN